MSRIHRFSVLALIGSASRDSSNHRLVAHLQQLAGAVLEFDMTFDPGDLPHFDPDRTTSDVPPEVQSLRNALAAADGVLVCTPEYIFSVPARLKNALEWCVATTVLNEKPAALITASASGIRAHDELQLILRTLGARFDAESCLLIQGIKSKVSADGRVTDSAIDAALARLLDSFRQALSRE